MKPHELARLIRAYVKACEDHKISEGLPDPVDVTLEGLADFIEENDVTDNKARYND